VVVAMEGNALLLALDGAGYRLRPLEAASGARFRREGDPAVEFWNRGETAQLTLGERRLPECRRDGT
jgi:membrane-bound inhibitor of C-type lysozyme